MRNRMREVCVHLKNTFVSSGQSYFKPCKVCFAETAFTRPVNDRNSWVGVGYFLSKGSGSVRRIIIENEDIDVGGGEDAAKCPCSPSWATRMQASRRC